MTCQEYERWMPEYLDGSLPAGERRLVERHVETCASCSGALAAHKSMDEMLSAGLTAPKLSGQFRGRLLERLGRLAVEQRRLRRLEMLEAVAYAAVVVAAGLAGPYIWKVFGSLSTVGGFPFGWLVAGCSAAVALWFVLSGELDPRSAAR